MENEEKTTKNLQKKSHETLLKILNNIGIIGAVLAGVADIIIVIILVVGLKIKQEMTSTIIFATMNALIGVLINVLLRFQGQKYAEIENAELCDKFYHNQIKVIKYITMKHWQIKSAIIDIFVKGFTAIFSIAGSIYICIEGSKNPVQILIAVVNLILFTCFGLISMNSSYNRFYNIQVPYMELQLKSEEIEENGTNQRRECIQDN